MTNLYSEIVKKLKTFGKTVDDIEFVCGESFCVDVKEFLEIAKKTNYDAGYGAQEVAHDLLIVGKDWWLERHEYDGSEWFEYKTMPKKPEKEKHIKRLAFGLWDSLEKMNDDEYVKEHLHWCE